MEKEIGVWCDKEADFLEVIFDNGKGYFRETDNDAVMEKVDQDGNILGLSILKVSALESCEPLSVILKSQAARDKSDPRWLPAHSLGMSVEWG